MKAYLKLNSNVQQVDVHAEDGEIIGSWWVPTQPGESTTLGGKEVRQGEKFPVDISLSLNFDRWNNRADGEAELSLPNPEQEAL